MQIPKPLLRIGAFWIVLNLLYDAGLILILAIKLSFSGTLSIYLSSVWTSFLVLLWATTEFWKKVIE